MLKFKSHEKIQITPHFDTSEFRCPCGTCIDNFVDKALVDKIEEIRMVFGEPLQITSGYRCPEHNKDVGGVAGSVHPSGLAADIKPLNSTKEKLDKLYALCYTNFDNVGDGRRLGFVHVDIRPAKPSGKRTWDY